MLRLKRLLLVGLTCVPRLELNGPALRHFESQPDSLRINQRFPSKVDPCQHTFMPTVQYYYQARWFISGHIEQGLSFDGSLRIGLLFCQFVTLIPRGRGVGLVIAIKDENPVKKRC
jgi:hypothetical protein